MRKVMFIGPTGVGKTTLIHALQGIGCCTGKTQTIQFINNMIDTPGEYAQMPKFYSALMVTSMDAALVVLLHDATRAHAFLPPGFTGMFARPVIGVINKIDLPGADVVRATKCLQQTGVKEPIFYISALYRQGVEELYSFIERRCVTK